MFNASFNGDVVRFWVKTVLKINPLSSNGGDKNIKVMRIKETITKDTMSSYFDIFSLQVPFQMYG